jgi:hypothetical protein
MKKNRQVGGVEDTTRTNSNTGHGANDPYDAVDEAFVSDIAKLYDTISNSRYEIGRHTDTYIEAKGGTRYGEATIERVCEHERIPCTSRTLRRYWDYYRLFSRYGKDLTKRCPSLTPSHMYELSRLLRPPMAGGDVSADEASRASRIRYWADWKNKIDNTKGGRKVTVDELARHITADMLEQQQAKSSVEDEAADDEESEVTAPPPRSKKRRPSPITFQSIGDAVDYMVAFAEPKHLESPNIKVAELVTDVERLSQAIVTICEWLADRGDDDSIRTTVTTMAERLADVAKQLEAGAAHSDLQQIGAQ